MAALHPTSQREARPCWLAGAVLATIGLGLLLDGNAMQLLRDDDVAAVDVVFNTLAACLAAAASGVLALDRRAA